MRNIVFTVKDKEYYKMMYEGLTATQTKGAETRTLAKIFIKLEDIGVPNPKFPSLYILEKESATVALEDAEYDLLKRLLETVEWNGLGARIAGRMLTWLDNIPQQSVTLEL